MDAKLKNPRTISLCNLNTTYHFPGRRQTACYVNYSNSQFKSTPLYSYCSYLVNYLNSILPLTHIQQTKFKYFSSIGYLIYRYSRVFPSILLALLVSSLYLSHTFSVSTSFSHAVSISLLHKPLHSSLH
jgi:hypothetical protein